LRDSGSGYKCKVVLGKTSTGSAEEIINAEEEFNVAVVTMSTHGRRGISRWAFGIITDKVLRGGKARNKSSPFELGD